MDFLKKLFGGGNDTGSRQNAITRLQVVLMHDRTDISPELLNSLRGDILDVLEKYMEIDKDKIQIKLGHESNIMALVANIPVRSIKRGSAIEANA